MGQSIGLLKLSPLRLRIAVVVLLGLGIFVGSGAVAWGQEGDLAKRVEDVATGVDFTWTLIAAFLVFFMQAGFAFLGAGLIRRKNTTNYMTKSFMDFAIASLSFWAFGFALMWGTSEAGIAGSDNFFLTDEAGGQAYVDWVFQMVFAATAATGSKNLPGRDLLREQRRHLLQATGAFWLRLCVRFVDGVLHDTG